MEEIYDVVVVGAGPSGSTAAYNIDNLNVLIVDKFDFPRFKACGGILNHLDDMESFGNYRNIKEKLQTYSSTEISFYWDRKFAFYRKYKQLFNHINRYDFDYKLLEVALSKNNVSFKKFHLKEIISEKDYFVLSDKTNHIKAKYIIGADGWDSMVSGFLGNKRSVIFDCGICLEYDLICEKRSLENHVFYFYKNEMGYAWLFPTEEGYYIGLGFVGKTKKSLKEYLEEFVQECIEKKLIPKEFKIKNIFGAPVPVKIVRKHVTNKIMLCGDALGSVKQVNGAGIYYAMLSGKIAGQTINLSTVDIKKRYEKSIQPIIKRVTFFKKIPPKIIILPFFYIMAGFSMSLLLPRRIKEKFQDWVAEKLIDTATFLSKI